MYAQGRSVRRIGQRSHINKDLFSPAGNNKEKNAITTLKESKNAPL